jgi:hypothetical protein
MKYRSEDDKCYGVAGMVIGLSIFDADSLFTGVSMDGDGLDCIQFTPDFFFSGNPRIPAKDSWQCIYSHYQISMGLVIANTMCRKMVLDRGQVDRKMRKALLDAASEEGKELCQLDEDEVEQIFDKSFSYLVRVFSNPNIRNAIKAFAEELKTRRNLTNYEVEDLLHYLNIV